MATYTAQILVGHAHLYHGGIIPSHILFLSENSRSAWILHSLNKNKKEITWIPDPHTLLKDAILMMAIHVMKVPEIIELAKSFNEKIVEKKFIEIYTALNTSERQKLYEECKKISWTWVKLIISVFNSSSLFPKDLSELKNYNNLEFEVCISLYCKYLNPFGECYDFIDKTEDEQFFKIF